MVEYRDPPIIPPRNPDVADDQLIENVLLYNLENPGVSVVLITDDVGLKMKARACGVVCVGLPEPYKTKPSEDPRDREIRTLKNLVKKYEEARPPEPEIQLTFGNGESVTNLSSSDWLKPYWVIEHPFFVVASSGRPSTPPKRHEVKPPPRTAAVVFRVSNSGTSPAINPRTFIRGGEGMKFRTGNGSKNPPWKMNFDEGKITITGEKLPHGEEYATNAVWITFAPDQEDFEAVWECHAENLPVKRQGVLKIHVADHIDRRN